MRGLLEPLTPERDVKGGKVYYCGAERLCQLYPVMNTKKYKPAMKAELMEGEFGIRRRWAVLIGWVCSCPKHVLLVDRCRLGQKPRALLYCFPTRTAVYGSVYCVHLLQGCSVVWRPRAFDALQQFSAFYCVHLLQGVVLFGVLEQCAGCSRLCH